MTSPPELPRKRPFRYELVFAVVMSLFMSTWLMWDVIHGHHRVDSLFSAARDIEVVMMKIKHLDEVLTMSTQMAAATGDPVWEARYHLHEPELEMSIKEAMRLDNDNHAAVQIEVANVVLVEMEHRAFDLVRGGDPVEAQRVLSSDEYTTLKKLYADGMAEFSDHMYQKSHSERLEINADVFRHSLVTAALFMLLIVGSIFVYWTMRRWQAAMTESNRELNLRTAELAELNTRLDMKVMERTKELGDSVLASLNMMEDAVQAREAAESTNEMLRRENVVRKTAETRVVYLNRVHAMLSGINTLIVRVLGQEELYEGACRIALEAGGFSMSMIGIVDRATMMIDPVASAGKDEEMMDAIKRLLSSHEVASTTMVARVISERKPVVSNESQDDPQVLLGKQYAKAGIRSMALLPLIVDGDVTGVFALYSGENEFFHEEEMGLLSELAGNIAFAMDHVNKQDRINHLAFFDELTGLANRNLLIERMTRYMKTAEVAGHSLALVLVDLDRFKMFNDSLGRQAGDALLRHVAEWLTQYTGDASMLARVGADQFAVVLPDVRDVGDVMRMIEKLMAIFLEHSFHLEDGVFRVAVKSGVAIFPMDGEEADTLFLNAEAALKNAKAGGDHYLFYTQKMTEAIAGKLTLENQLREAIDREEFVLHYQPKVNIASGELTSAEALIRWNDPRTGMIPPSRFIPVLEETGLIHEAGRWALHKAIADYLYWRELGLPAVRVAVNVTALQLRSASFIDELEQVLAVDVHAAEGLELEITESLVMADIKHSIATLQAVRALGVTVSIDDFGTGFSSLSYLAKLPVDALKIDRSFVKAMTHSAQGQALVGAIITLAHSLKLLVVAEGVETDAQLRLLRLLGCDEMQGFLVSKALPVRDFEARFLTPG